MCQSVGGKVKGFIQLQVFCNFIDVVHYVLQQHIVKIVPGAIARKTVDQSNQDIKDIQIIQSKASKRGTEKKEQRKIEYVGRSKTLLIIRLNVHGSDI